MTNQRPWDADVKKAIVALKDARKALADAGLKAGESKEDSSQPSRLAALFKRRPRQTDETDSTRTENLLRLYELEVEDVLRRVAGLKYIGDLL